MAGGDQQLADLRGDEPGGTGYKIACHLPW
jgi:hypothetical protein